MLTPLDLRASCDADTLTVSCRGAVDLFNCVLIEDAGVGAVATGAQLVVLDLSDVGTMDISGIMTIDRLVRDLCDEEIGLIVRGACDSVRRTFASCGRLHLLADD
jgi:anti-anti-sigma factor